MVGLLCFIKYLVESCCTFISFSFFLSVFICVIFFRYFYSLPFLLWKTTFPTFIRYPTDIINERFNRKKKDVSYILKVYHDSFYELCGIEPYEVCFGFFFLFLFWKAFIYAHFFVQANFICWSGDMLEYISFNLLFFSNTFVHSCNYFVGSMDGSG